MIVVVRDLSFRWLELVLKGKEGLSLQCRVERGASVGPSKAAGQKRTHTSPPHAVAPRKDTGRMHTCRCRRTARENISRARFTPSSHKLLKHKAANQTSPNQILSALLRGKQTSLCNVNKPRLSNVAAEQHTRPQASSCLRTTLTK